MILFKLKCARGHEFDAWFRDNAAYDRQSGRDQIACPDCGEKRVMKAPMAPSVLRAGGRDIQKPVAAAAPVPEAALTPQELRAKLRELRRQVEAACDDVGDDFAEEARAMERGDTPARGIYGEATPEESRALEDEGIETIRIPWVSPNDA